MSDLDKLRRTIWFAAFFIYISIILSAVGIASAIRSLGHG